MSRSSNDRFVNSDRHASYRSGEREVSTSEQGELVDAVLQSISYSAEIASLIYGIYPVRRLLNSFRLLTDRKEQGLNGSMQFTYRNPERSTSPNRIIEGAKSIVTFALPIDVYEAEGDLIFPHLLSRYARRDYYGILRNELEEIRSSLLRMGVNSKVVLDSNELIDKEVAVRSGVGSYLKNSLVNVTGFGSATVIGSIVTDVNLPRTPVRDRLVSCGRCQICIDSCPTSAIGSSGSIDARRCISWLLQSPEEIDPRFLAAIGTRLYGCDLCQDVCPINRSSATTNGDDITTVDAMAKEILQIFSSSDSAILELLSHLYIYKRDARLIRRNAIIVAANLGASSNHESDILAWIDRLNSSDTFYRPYVDYFFESRAQGFSRWS